jgi:60 kDa SS-A/Ro ribonucleoprotein
MGKFNTKTVAAAPTATNYAGGQAYAKSPELELVSILLTSFVSDQYYRSADDTTTRLKEVLSIVDPLFAAKAAIYARTKYGMRSVSHITASEIAKRLQGQTWAKSFYNAVIYRPDDLLEIVSYHQANNGKLSNAMKGGFALAFDKFDGYQLAKYRGEGKGTKLVDVVNMVHPVPVEKNAEAIKQLVAGELKSTETWEAKLSASGGDAELKGKAWIELIREKKIGYLALLRNLKNILEQAPEALNDALASLTNEGFIKKSLIFPFQYLVAYKQFADVNSKEARLVADALSTAVDISCQNVQSLNFDGNTLVAVDNSGSMTNPVSSSRHMRCSELGALFGIVLAKAVNADIMEFGDFARYIPYTLSEHSMNFAANFSNNNKVGHGTNFHSIFQQANKKYERILIFSDMQGWIGYYTPVLTAQQYRKNFDAAPFIYSFDLAGLGTMQFPQEKVFCLAGFSDKIFQTMAMLETDKEVLINEIKAVTF